MHGLKCAFAVLKVFCQSLFADCVLVLVRLVICDMGMVYDRQELCIIFYLYKTLWILDQAVQRWTMAFYATL